MSFPPPPPYHPQQQQQSYAPHPDQQHATRSPGQGHHHGAPYIPLHTPGPAQHWAQGPSSYVGEGVAGSPHTQPPPGAQYGGHPGHWPVPITAPPFQGHPSYPPQQPQPQHLHLASQGLGGVKPTSTPEGYVYSPGPAPLAFPSYQTGPTQTGYPYLPPPGSQQGSPSQPPHNHRLQAESHAYAPQRAGGPISAAFHPTLHHQVHPHVPTPTSAGLPPIPTSANPYHPYSQIREAATHQSSTFGHHQHPTSSPVLQQPQHLQAYPSPAPSPIPPPETTLNPSSLSLLPPTHQQIQPHARLAPQAPAEIIDMSSRPSRHAAKTAAFRTSSMIAADEGPDDDDHEDDAASYVDENGDNEDYAPHVETRTRGRHAAAEQETDDHAAFKQYQSTRRVHAFPAATRGQHMAQAQAYKGSGVKEEPVVAHTRSGRTVNKPPKYGENDFEAGIVPSSPAHPDVGGAEGEYRDDDDEDDRPRKGTRKGKGKKKVVDPDEDEEEEEEEEEEEDEEGDEGEYVEEKPSVANGSGRATRNSLGSAVQNGAPKIRLHLARPPPVASPPRSQRTPRKAKAASEEDFDPDASADSATPSASDESDDPLDEGYHSPSDSDDDGFVEYSPRSKAKRARRAARQKELAAAQPPRRSTRTAARARAEESDGDYGGGGGGRRGRESGKRQLRERTGKVNYELPPLELDVSSEMVSEAVAQASGPGRGRAGGGAGGRKGFAARFGAAFGAAGAALGGIGGGAGRLGGPGGMRPMGMGDPDTSDSDLDFMGPPTAGAAGAGGAGGAIPQGGVGGQNRQGGPSDVPNFGRVNPKSSTADADPLGVDVNVTFDRVGGLDSHINQLKEMVALPLLYPELYQQFGIIPPRGVLFHGPPGTGKTLLARALAASCSTGNTKIAFFMRKGADVLSKWVGEAERQLRMLFEEARAAQPSIIFFDEIDGLAPVRSSKQDQIHASLVSTLLALMDGMDGRGQVIVIGATNRPDAVDPALRRPGRFDREFYFPLPNKEARMKIIRINTREWTPVLDNGVVEWLGGMTKGYGGADLRALCTEAALNAIQRSYPQIYKTADRLVVNPASIQVGVKDFMMSIKKIVPSSQRSTASPATPLPPHLTPLLQSSLERLKAAVDAVLPPKKERTALEEAEYEDDTTQAGASGSGGEVERLSLMQSFDKMRTYRPRVLLYGPKGMGQAYLGPAILHHLEGYHVQSLDLGSLMGDSTRTIEAAIIQLFVEAKRHQPSILFIPSMHTWPYTLTEQARQTFEACLENVGSNEPVLVLGVMDGEEEDVRAGEIGEWMGGGVGAGEWIQLIKPDQTARSAYFTPLFENLQLPPTSFPSTLPPVPRQLPDLPRAAPLPPREPTAVELEREFERDQTARNMMVLSFSGLVQEFLKKYRRVVAGVREDAFALSALLEEQAALAEEARLAQAAEIAASGEASVEHSQPLPLLGDGSGLPNGHAHSSASQPNPTGAGEHDESLGASTAISDLPPSQAQPDSLTPLPPSYPAGSSLDPLTPLPGSQQSVPDHSNMFSLPSAGLIPRTPVDSRASTPGPSPAPPISTGTWHANNVDLDIMSHRLSTHKYHTPSMFLADIAAIEDNASQLGDPDRQARIAGMAAEARLHVGGFDRRWDAEFERLKERMDKRKEERRARKEREKEKDGAIAGVPSVTVTAADAKTAPTIALPGAAEVSTLKRQREGELELHEERDGKRPREGEMDIDPPASNHAIVIPSPAAPASAPGNLEEPTIPPPPRPTAPPNPPFILPDAAMEALRTELVDKTRHLSVDQLESLRAGLFDRLWRNRGEWDRSTVVDEMREWVQRFVARAEKRMGGSK